MSIYMSISYFDIYICISYFDSPTGSSKYGTTRKNTQRYYKPKRLISHLLSNCYFLLLSPVLLFISQKAGKAKRIEKRSAHSRLVKQVF